MKNEKIFQPSTLNFASGFTLIELLVVISIISIISSVGIASFIGYSRSQALATSTLEVATLLNTARSRALSQVKPDACLGKLQAYKILICGQGSNCIPENSNSQYQLAAVCDNSLIIVTKSLAANVTFGSDTPFVLYFPILRGGATITNKSPAPAIPNRITVQGYGLSKTIDVSANDATIILN